MDIKQRLENGQLKDSSSCYFFNGLLATSCRKTAQRRQKGRTADGSNVKRDYSYKLQAEIRSARPKHQVKIVQWTAESGKNLKTGKVNA